MYYSRALLRGTGAGAVRPRAAPSVQNWCCGRGNVRNSGPGSLLVREFDLAVTISMRLSSISETFVGSDLRRHQTFHNLPSYLCRLSIVFLDLWRYATVIYTSGSTRSRFFPFSKETLRVLGVAALWLYFCRTLPLVNFHPTTGL